MSDLEVNITPGQANDLMLTVTRKLQRDEQRHWLTLLARAHREGWDAHRVEMDKQARAQPGYPIEYVNPYEGLLDS